MPRDTPELLEVPPLPRTVEILDEMARLLADRHRWTKHTWRHDGSPPAYCVGGAIYAVTGAPLSLRWPRRDVRDVQSALRRALPRGWRAVVSYNDHPLTSHEDVLHLIRHARAIVVAEADHNGASR